MGNNNTGDKKTPTQKKRKKRRQPTKQSSLWLIAKGYPFQSGIARLIFMYKTVKRILLKEISKRGN